MLGSQSQRSTSGIDEETVLKTAAPRKGVQSAILWCSAILKVAQTWSLYGVRAASLYHFLLRSSTAEQPVDNRQTVERHHAEGPLFIAGWLRQMSGGPKTRRGWRDSNSGGHFMQSSLGFSPKPSRCELKLRTTFKSRH